MKKIKYLFRKFRLLIVAVALGIIAITSWSFSDNFFEISKNIDIFVSLYKEINLRYVDETDPGKMMQKAIDAMLESLDPYTNFIPESEIEDYRFMTTGQYGGVGAMIQKKGDYVMVSEPYEGFPAQKADIRAGDIIMEINDNSTKGKSTSDVSAILKGQPGSKAKVVIKRDGEKDFLIKEVVRQEIKIDNIPYYGMLNENIGYIKLTQFTENAGNEVKNAFTDLKAKNDLKGIVLDLRGNGGGLLKEAVNIVNVWTKKGQEVVSTRGKMTEGNRSHLTLNTPSDLDIPLAVLVNSGSASASEIVSGSIQDLDRGVIIGQRTYGKGLVQNVYPLTYNTQVKITIAKYYIPSGRCIQAIDYAHRNEDGSVGKFADSLAHPFKTKSGRIVYDGGGILPDVKTDIKKYGEITISLIMKQLIFDYVTIYRRTNNTIAQAKEFKITDETYADFVKFLADKEYDYKTKTEKEIEDLQKTAKEEKYFDKIKSEYDALKSKLIHNKNEDLQTNKDEIKEILREEIVSRYYFQKGRIEASLTADKDAQKAIEILENSATYKSLLSASNKSEIIK